MRNSEAITVWCDETSIKLDDKCHIIGTLITDSDLEELKILNEIIKLRKKHKIWTTFHGSNISWDKKQLDFFSDFLDLFSTNEMYFHIFLYKEDRKYANSGFEKYFAKQSAFSLGLKLKKEGYSINTIFSKVGTVRFLFDRRTGESVRGLDSDYKKEIKRQLKKQSKRSDDLTVRFSFISSECFDLMQMTDIFLYAVKLYLEDKYGSSISDKQKKLVEIFKDKFITEKMKSLSDYEYTKKINFFKSM